MENRTEGAVEATCASGWLVQPLVPEEGTWEASLLGGLYFGGMLYALIGLALFSDVCMGAVERITQQTTHRREAKRRAVGGKEGGWNAVFANLTLIPLAIAVPEVMLGVLDGVGLGLLGPTEGSGLGPSAVIGTSALSLLLTLALAPISTPNQQHRAIRLLTPFLLTSSLGVVAYVWLFLALGVVSPKAVEVWEAALLLLFLPLAILAGWVTGRRWKLSSKAKPAPQRSLELGTAASHEGESMLKAGSEDSSPKSGLEDFYKRLRQRHDLSEFDMATLLAAKETNTEPHSRLWYRIEAMRRLTGGNPLRPPLSKKLTMIYESQSEPLANGDSEQRLSSPRKDAHAQKAVVEFREPTLFLTDVGGKLKISVVRHGRLDNTARVRVESTDRTAKAGRDYVEVNKQLAFGPFVTEREAAVLVTEEQWRAEVERGLEFSLSLSMVDEEYYRDSVELGECVDMRVRSARSVEALLHEGRPHPGFYSHWRPQVSGLLGLRKGMGCLHICLHALAFPWKVLACLVPPARYAGGWLCLCVALLALAVLAAVLGALTNAFACVAGVEPFLLGMLLLPIALGMPDLLAAPRAAAQELSADTPIGYLGATNVLRAALGLGLPWLISALCQGPINEGVELGDSSGLGWVSASALVYAAIAAGASVLLLLRRLLPACGKSELGGGCLCAWGSALLFLCLWLAFLAFNALHVYSCFTLPSLEP